MTRTLVTLSILAMLAALLPTTAADGAGSGARPGAGSDGKQPPVRRDPTEADAELERALRKDEPKPTGAGSGPRTPVRVALPALPPFALKARMIAGTRRAALVAIGERTVLIEPEDTFAVSVGKTTTLKLTVRAFDARGLRIHVMPHDVEVLVR